MEECKVGGKCFVLMVGIPGAGKSTMARAIKEAVFDSVVIEFD
jgi:adenylate kinase family enzyme